MFHNGTDTAAAVTELPAPFAGRRDIQIGVVDID